MAASIALERNTIGKELSPFFHLQGLDIHLSKTDRNRKRKEAYPNPAITGIPPRGYVTLEQFAEDTKKIINDYCDLYDIH